MLRDLSFDRAFLITSGFHMPRAVATFRAIGVEVIAVSTDVRSIEEFDLTILDFLPDAGALAKSTEAIKELMGLLVYRTRGWA